MNEIRMRYPQGLAKCLTLSYDDGVEQDMRLCRIMNDYEIAGTFNLNSGLYAPEGKVYEPGRVHRRMTLAKCLETYKDNPLFEVATHALTHGNIPDIPKSEAYYQIVCDRRNLEAQFGGFCRGHAYANGAFSDTAAQMLADCGIAYARTTVSTHNFKLPENWLILNPTCHHADPELFELADKFLNKEIRFAPEMFYLWGHAYEFESADNWNVIEDFCKKMSGRDDIWYATNIQVCDYTQAYKKLIYSADAHTVCNPTSTDLWILADRKDTYKIPKGETVKI